MARPALDSMKRPSAVAALVTLGLCVACSLLPVTVEVRNDSSAPVSDVAVTVSNVVGRIGDLPPGEQRSARFWVSGETGVVVSFRNAQGEVLTHGPDGYLEGASRGTVRFRLDQQGVAVAEWDVDPGAPFTWRRATPSAR